MTRLSPSGRAFVAALLAFCVVAGGTSLAVAGKLCCSHCGRDSGCRKVCRLVCEDRKITKVCWGRQCEDFCVPGPTWCGKKHCEMVCTECANPNDPKAVTTGPSPLVWRDWIPGRCACVHTRARLMKKTVTKTVPSYKWQVEYLCAGCEEGCTPVTHPADALIPPPPAVDGAKIIPGQVAPAPAPVK